MKATVFPGVEAETMRAAVAWDDAGALGVETCGVPVPAAGEVLVRIAACGICHTDLGAAKKRLNTPLPRILGHEGAGVVEAVGPGVISLQPGDHVILSYLWCGVCALCRAGHPYYCTHARSLNFGGEGTSQKSVTCCDTVVGIGFFGQSSFAGFALANQRNAVKIDPATPWEIAAAVGCGVQTGAGTVLNVLNPRAGQNIAIFGAGTVGLAAVMAAKIAGCRHIIAIDIHPSRLELAAAVGATDVIVSTGDIAGKVRDITANKLDFAIDTTGVPEIVTAMVDALAPLGRAACVAAPNFGAPYHFNSTQFLTKGLALFGVVQGQSIASEFLIKLLDYWNAGRLPLEKIIRMFDFEDVGTALLSLENAEVVKPVLMMR